MNVPVTPPAHPGRWTSLGVVALLSLLGQLWLCQFFTFGQYVPETIDINPSNLWKFVYHFPPTGTFEVLNWLGVAQLPQPLNPFTLAAHWGPWFFFTAYAPVISTLALLAMAAFLRELEVPRPAALFAAVVYAWQGDLLAFIFPAHFGYITTWPFYARAAWGALRSARTGYWAYAVISGAGCGLMVELEQDRGGIASLLIAALYLAPVMNRLYRGNPMRESFADLRNLTLCVAVALMVTLASFLALFQTNIVGVKLGGQANRAQVYSLATQFCLSPEETLTYFVPGVFGWHSQHPDGPYWGDIGERPDWSKNHSGRRNFNLAISTAGTVATFLGLLGVFLVLPGNLLGPSPLTDRQRFYGRWLLVLGLITLMLSWGWHTSFYRSLFLLPLMDKWRDPLKWLEMTNFALITLSAFGVQHLVASLNPDAPATPVIRQRLTWFWGLVTGLLGGGVVLGYFYGGYVLPAKLQSDGLDPDSINAAISTLHVALLIAFALMGLIGLVVFGLWSPDKLRAAKVVNPWINQLWQAMLRLDRLPLTLVLCLTALSVVQLAWVANQFIGPVRLSLTTASNPLLDALRTESDNSGHSVRVSVAPDDMVLNGLLQNQFNAYHIPSMDISAASRIPDDLNAFFGALANDRARLWFLAGVKNVAVPQQYVAQLHNDPVVAANVDHAYGFSLEPTSTPNTPSHALIGLRDYMAKATFVPYVEVIPTEKAMLQHLADQAWNPRTTILLSEPPPALPDDQKVIAHPTEPDKVDLKSYSPTDIRVDVQTALGGYILINDQFDPDWLVDVNGRPAPLLRADFILRAVQVPPGASTITMRYVSRYHVGPIIRQMTGINLGNITLSASLVGALCDGAMLAAWLIAGLAIWRRRAEDAFPVQP